VGLVRGTDSKVGGRQQAHDNIFTGCEGIASGCLVLAREIDGWSLADSGQAMLEMRRLTCVSPK